MADAREALSSHIQLAWIALEATLEQASTTTTPNRRIDLAEYGASGTLWLVIEDGCRGILLRGEFTDDIFDLATTGVAIRRRPQLLGDQPVDLLMVRTTEARLNDVFVALALDIARRLAAGQSMQFTLICAMEEFKALLRQSGKAAFSMEQTIGLLGELLFLRNLAQLAPQNAVDAWTGALGAAHDFVTQHALVEVKTTMDRPLSSIPISSLEQLQSPDGRPLFMLVSVVARAAVGLSVPSLVHDLLSMPIRAGLLHELLETIGYTREIESTLAERRFSVIESRVYGVVEGFPRITHRSFVGSQVPLGVDGVTYFVDLTRAEDHRVPPPRSGQVAEILAGRVKHAP